MALITRKEFAVKYGVTLANVGNYAHRGGVQPMRRKEEFGGEALYDERELVLAMCTAYKDRQDALYERAMAWRDRLNKAKAIYRDSRKDDEHAS